MTGVKRGGQEEETMDVETLNTTGGRIQVHLICLGRSLRQGRFGSVGFFCAGIWRELRQMQKETRQPGRMAVAGGSRVGGARLCMAGKTEEQ